METNGWTQQLEKRLNFNWPWDREFVELTLSGNFQMLNKNVAEEEFITRVNVHFKKARNYDQNL